MNQTNHQSEIIDDDLPEHNPDQFRQDVGGLVTAHNGIADRLLQNDKLYNTLKGDWKRTEANKSKNIITTTGREDGKFYIRREQLNYQAVVERCKRYREAAEAGVPDPLAPLTDDGKLAWRWMDLPSVVEQRISDEYFGGMRWSTIKRDKVLKAQFYRVVQREYPEYTCYPGGKLPIPVAVSYPNRTG